MQFIIKILLSAIILALVSELGKRFTTFSAILASLPTMSILAMIWLYNDTKDVQKIIDLSNSIFFMVIPSLIFFLVLPLFLKNGFNFLYSIFISSTITFFSYSLYIFILAKIGIKF